MKDTCPSKTDQMDILGVSLAGKKCELISKNHLLAGAFGVSRDAGKNCMAASGGVD